MERPLPNSYWVVKGSLLAGESPAGATVQETRQRLQRLLDAGIDGFFDLTQLGELPEYRLLLPPHVQYVRHPIADAQVPARIAQMHAIQSQLQAALAVGRRLYVHCRAGIGRTGTVIGCYLAEQGLEGRAALGQLNVLWRQCARSGSWPELPQTPEQAAYIVRWPRHRRPGVKAAAWRATRELRTHFHSTLLGLAVGDALSVSMRDKRPFGPWADDTAMALCLAESLIESGGFDPQDQRQRYARWQREGHLSSLEAAPLSRVAAVVLFYFRKRADAISYARRAAQLAKAAPVMCDACAVLAAMLHAAMRNEPIDRVLYPLASPAGWGGLDAALAAAMRADARQRPAETPEPAARVLSVVRWVLASGAQFSAGAQQALKIGEDMPLIGAVYGQLAGALYGRRAIPASWIEHLARRPLIEDMAEQLLKTALAGLPAADSGATIG
ncbi:MAG TPA: ADP-ribosylglycohydrolase family protein [Steroidobacteraceae bacterium]